MPIDVTAHVPSPTMGLEYLPPGPNVLTLPLLQQNLLCRYRSFAVTGLAIADE